MGIVEVNRSFLPDRAFLQLLLGKSSATSRGPKRNQEIGFKRHLQASESKSRGNGERLRKKENEIEI